MSGAVEKLIGGLYKFLTGKSLNGARSRTERRERVSERINAMEKDRYDAKCRSKKAADDLHRSITTSEELTQTYLTEMPEQAADETGLPT